MKVAGKAVASLVDAFGELDAKIKELETKKKEVRTKLEELGLVPGKYEGSNFELSISETVTYSFDVESVFKKLGKEKFLKCVKISKEKLDEFMAPVQQQEFITETKVSRAYRPKMKK